ncbi:putative bifunctional diguanylate cyclase/phosphodiesterase [Kaistia nematophila]|uniref:Bifunctional diguanylate cyclase/phosphodiesterase n=1 Tax=Kaistia nematophila TaxID=2994654 RepID=A0A9X3E2H1_9HYPH|nr:bifunctional diguanylate cyclase/phosphodiesterase [Kaistia nematophila]MCX5570474.1 bifunctional diguanylate cyclase/phosphodiesterase [Kaistia nematophila]
MSFFKGSTFRFAFRVAVPVLLVLAGSIMFMLFTLNEMAGEVDRIDDAAIERSVSASLHSLQRRLRDTHGDYAVWDDAAAKLYGQVDQDFAISNYKDGTRSGVFFDAAYLLDEKGQAVFSFRRGGVAPRGALEEFGSPLQALVAGLAGNYHAFDATVGLMRDRSGAVAVVAVGSVFPSSSAVAKPVGRPRMLVLARVLDDLTIRQMAQDFVIDGMALRFDPDKVDHGVRLVDPTGKAIGALTWARRSHGGEAFSRVAPMAYLTLGVIGLTILFLLGIGYANLVAVRRRERQAVYDANHDSLTGLPNRAALTRALGVASRRYPAQPLAVLFLDLDGFKEVNDSYGHEIGDRLLQHVARGFESICSRRGLLARVGGDEFALVLDNRDSVASAEEIGSLLVRYLASPIIIDDRVIVIGTSVGIAVVEDEAVTADELLRRADVAMYQAKELGRSRVSLYDRSIDAEKIDRKRLANELREAVETDALHVVYQPIFDAQTMRPALVEALLRWKHPRDGFIPPDLFISVAEENGLMDAVGNWVLRNACRDALRWPDIRLSINVSPVQFRNPGFDRNLAAILAETGLPPARLEVEMTETHLVTFPDRAQHIVASLRILGVSVALDDFGKGYSSIGYLRRFSFDKLKIDRSLVHGVSIDLETRRLCEATVALGRALNLEVTAEGIETEADGEIMRQAGCAYLQGFAFARPMSAAHITELLDDCNNGSDTDEVLRTA